MLISVLSNKSCPWYTTSYAFHGCIGHSYLECIPSQKQHRCPICRRIDLAAMHFMVQNVAKHLRVTGQNFSLFLSGYGRNNMAFVSAVTLQCWWYTIVMVHFVWYKEEGSKKKGARPYRWMGVLQTQSDHICLVQHRYCCVFYSSCVGPFQSSSTLQRAWVQYTIIFITLVGVRNK